MIEVIGANHKTAPLELRERLTGAVPTEGEGLRAARETCGLDELAVLSTCNRIEFYFSRSCDTEHFGHWLSSAAGLSRDAADSALYRFRGAEAARHLFRVTCGLDAMVLGETEVFAQVKSAYEAARKAGTTGSALNPLFQRAFAAAKRVHSTTDLCKGSVSVGSVAARLIKREAGGLSGRLVVVIGAGAMAENLLANVAGLGSPRVVVVNRSSARGAALARRFGGRTAGLGEIGPLLASADVVIASTSGRSYLVTAESLRARSGSRPLVILDASVPRNVDPRVADKKGVRLFNIDDLKALSGAAAASRRGKAVKADAVVDEEVEAYRSWLAARQVLPVVEGLKSKASRIAEAEVEAAVKSVRSGASAESQLHKLAQRLTNRLLHDPLSALKAAADGEEAERLSEAARVLHGLPENGAKGKAER